jgi:hypothetical protein
MFKKILITLVLFIAGTIPAINIHAGWNYITLSSYYTFPGQTITVNGNGFTPGEAVTITLIGTSKNTIVNGSGQFTSPSFTVPYSAIGSTVSVTASTPSGSGSADLVVGTYYPHVDPSSWYLIPGSTIQFTGKNFAPNEPVIIQSAGNTINTVTTNNSGSFISPSVNTPSTGDVISYTFTGQNSHTSYSVTVHLAHWGGVTTLDTYAGQPGSSVHVNGNGFGSNEGVNLNFNSQLWGWASTTPNGTFNFSNTVPSWATVGPNIVLSIGNSTGMMGQATYTLLSPTPSMPSVINP